jgi:hypothetical protein
MPAAFCFRISQVTLTGYSLNVLAVFTRDLHRGTLFAERMQVDGAHQRPASYRSAVRLGRARGAGSMVLGRQALAVNNMADTSTEKGPRDDRKLAASRCFPDRSSMFGVPAPFPRVGPLNWACFTSL